MGKVAAKSRKKTVAKKRAVKSKPVATPKEARKVLVLRTCDKDLKSHDGFQWPQAGTVTCGDWDQKPQCGNGLHGLLWGEGDGCLLNFNPESKWLVVEVEESSIVDLKGKVKFPRGDVVHCGDRTSATAYLIERLTRAASVVGVVLAGGYRSTLTGGDRSTLTGGDWSTLEFRFCDSTHRRCVVAYVGENGIKPNTKYRLNDKYEFEAVD